MSLDLRRDLAILGLGQREAMDNVTPPPLPQDNRSSPQSLHQGYRVHVEEASFGQITQLCANLGFALQMESLLQQHLLRSRHGHALVLRVGDQRGQMRRQGMAALCAIQKSIEKSHHILWECNQSITHSTEMIDTSTCFRRLAWSSFSVEVAVCGCRALVKDL